jgi:hypothetical protein
MAAQDQERNHKCPRESTPDSGDETVDVWQPHPYKEDGYYYGTTAAVNNLYAWHGYTRENHDQVQWGYGEPAHELFAYLRGLRAGDEAIMQKIDEQWYPLKLDLVPIMNPIQTQNKRRRDK